MDEQNLINIIKNQIGSGYIGDDCAYIKELGIVVTQDSLVENIHFKRDWCTPVQLGYKSVTVNISDILASGAKPEYITIALSLPSNCNENFVRDFYYGAESALNGAKIIGGDLTGSSKDIMISITAIGTTKNRNISSRINAKIGYSVITNGIYGLSAYGLKCLINDISDNQAIKAHLEPKIDYAFSTAISTLVKEPYAMMDTSDGLCDALFKIAEASNIKINIDYKKIPHTNGLNKEQILFGGEDYNLIAVIPDKYVSRVPNAVLIGSTSEYDGIRIDISGESFKRYSQLNVYNHFGEANE